MPLKRYSSLDEFSFHHTLDSADGINVVLFTKPSCSSCRHWKALLQHALTKRLDIRVFEVDVEVSPALAREFELFHLPAVFIYRDGAFHGEVQCEGKLEVFERALLQTLQRGPVDPP